MGVQLGGILGGTLCGHHRRAPARIHQLLRPTGPADSEIPVIGYGVPQKGSGRSRVDSHRDLYVTRARRGRVTAATRLGVRHDNCGTTRSDPRKARHSDARPRDAFSEQLRRASAIMRQLGWRGGTRRAIACRSAIENGGVTGAPIALLLLVVGAFLLICAPSTVHVKPANGSAAAHKFGFELQASMLGLDGSAITRERLRNWMARSGSGPAFRSS